MSMYDELDPLDIIFDVSPVDREPRQPAVVITNSVSSRIRGANEDIEVSLDDEGTLFIKQDIDIVAMDRDEAEALFMTLGHLLSL